jgi:hypothetical protein
MNHAAALALFWHHVALLLFTLFAAFGLLKIVGTYRRWACFIDTARMRRMSKRFGTEYAITFSYLIGAGLTVVSLFNLALARYGLPH